VVLVLIGVLLLSPLPLHASRTAIATDLSIDSEIDGDVLIIGGELRLGPSAHVHGDAIVIFGGVQRNPAAQIDGRILHLGNLAALDPSFETRRHTRFSVFLLTTGFWLLVTTIPAMLMRKQLGRALYQLKVIGWRILPFALLIQLTLLGALLAALGLGPRLAAPLTGLVLGTAVVLKVLGLALLGWRVGALIVPRSSYLPLNAKVFAGVLLFNVLRLIPVVGGQLWILLSVLALGCSVLVLGAGGKVPVSASS